MFICLYVYINLNFMQFYTHTFILINLTITIIINKFNMKPISQNDLKKILNSPILYSKQQYIIQQDKYNYIYNLVSFSIIKMKLNIEKLSLHELSDVMNSLGFELTTQQLHQMFLYCTLEFKHKTNITIKDKLVNFFNEQSKKINLQLLTKWLIDKLDSLKIKKVKKQLHKTIHRSISKQKIRAVSQKGVTLPLINKSFNQSKLQNQLKPLIQIFQQMERLRQDSGLIPINLSTEENNNLIQIPIINIPYDPQLKGLNQNLIKLKIKAQDQLKRILQIAREDPDIRKKLQTAITKFQKSRIQTSEKIGKTGAINAMKRLVQRRKKELDKRKYLNLDPEQDLQKAARIYTLLNLPQTKSKLIY